MVSHSRIKPLFLESWQFLKWRKELLCHPSVLYSRCETTLHQNNIGINFYRVPSVFFWYIHTLGRNSLGIWASPPSAVWKEWDEGFLKGRWCSWMLRMKKNFCSVRISVLAHPVCIHHNHQYIFRFPISARYVFFLKKHFYFLRYIKSYSSLELLISTFKSPIFSQKFLQIIAFLLFHWIVLTLECFTNYYFSKKFTLLAFISLLIFVLSLEFSVRLNISVSFCLDIV